MGHVKPPEMMQLEGMTEELSNQLHNLCMEIYANIPYIFQYPMNAWVSFNKALNELFQLKYGTLAISDNVGDHFYLNEWYEKLNWHQKISLVEFLFSKTRNSEINALLEKANKILERENSGYRINEDLQFVQITDPVELEEVAKAQRCEINSVREHMAYAVSSFSDRKNPDYTNAIGEAVRALEGLTKHITGNEKGTLGSAVKGLTKIPKHMKEAIDKIYAMRNDDLGVAHALKSGQERADFDTAKYTIVVTSALINYILSMYPTEAKE